MRCIGIRYFCKMKLRNAIILILLTAGFFGRPSLCSHEGKLSEYAASLISINPNSREYSTASAFILYGNLEYNDYYIFTTCSVDGNVITIGLPKYVYIFDKSLIIKTLLL